jgi:ubiquinone/menaquinone biosynthesis C-methylase UbiE
VITHDDGERMRALYGERFSGEDAFRRDMWAVLCREFFQNWIARDAVVLDVAAGTCDFVNAIDARERIALDLNPAVTDYAAPGVRTLVGRADDMAEVEDGTVDVVFVSNFFEHIDRDTILRVLAESRRVLRPGGRLLVLQPNIRFGARDYWMFFDHITAIDDRALVEAFRLAGFEVTTVVPRFLPFTTKGRLPRAVWLVRAYLAFRPAWRLFGKQSFLVAERR